MRKVVITIPTLKAGGMERAAINYARILMKKGIEVKFFLISSNEIFYDIPQNVEILFGKKKLNNVWLTPYSLLKLRNFIKSYKPNFVFSFSGKVSCYVIMSLKGLEVSVIPFHRASPFKIYGWLNNKLNEYYFPKCRALVVQTETGKQIFRNKYKHQNVISIPNPIRELNIQTIYNKKKIILTVSRLVNGKGIDKLIDIFSQLKRKDWYLFIVGDGYLKNDLIKFAHKLNIGDKVCFIGYTKRVDYYLSIASIFAFTSESEGYPNSLLEAMCAGLPSISFDCPTGPSEMIIDGKNGFLVSMNDSNQYIAKLKKLLDSPDLRKNFGKEAKKLNSKHNSSEILNPLICELF